MRRTGCSQSSFSSSISLPLVSLLIFSIVISVMAEPAPSSSEAAVHIVYTEKPAGDDPEAVHIRTLASVLGSEEAAKESLIYVYKAAATGFSAKLTPAQVDALSEQPGVLQVVQSQKMQLHSSGPGKLF